MSGLVGGGAMLQRLTVINDFMTRTIINDETQSGAIGKIVPKGAIVYKTIVSVTHGWDGASSPTIKIGTTNDWEGDDDEEIFFSTGMIDLTTPGNYVSRRVYQMIDDGQLLIDIDHDGSAVGRAIITQLFAPGEYA